MSSDLLKEFGSPEVNPWRGVASQSPATKASAAEDDFGDFEDPENGMNALYSHERISPRSNAVRYPVDSDWSGTQPQSMDRGYLQSYVHSSTSEVQDAPSNEDDWGDFSQQSVIFDADIEATWQKKEADGTFVDQHRPKEPTDILLHPTTNTKAFTPAPPVPAQTEANDSQGSLKLAKCRHHFLKDDFKRRVEATKSKDLEQPTIDGDPWVDFEAAEAARPMQKPPNTPPSHTLEVAEASIFGPPPSNIPPPSILLPVIATVLVSLATNLKTVTSHQSLDQPSTLSQLHPLLSTIRAAARILAGRKLRWKRDNILSQSMKIGPAHSGKRGGMKLAGVDKAESRREDQEAAEALQIWKQQAGPLRSTIATLNGQLPETERFKIPEIADSMPIRQGRPSEGMVTAPRCCFLCGIKRDERIAKVDVDVEDSFGEWWVEHWGHFDCVAFWENHKDLLRQR
ncbi:MAG: hypothetical protein Q9175_004807 [Cornicularia normoerica]